MGVLAFSAGSLFAFGPLLVLFLLVVAQRATLVVVCIAGSFTCLLGILLASAIWMLVVPLHETLYFIIPIAVMLQEVLRFLSWRFMVRKVEWVLFVQSGISLHTSAFVFGLGYGATQSLMFFSGVLGDSTGPGCLFASSCYSVPVVFLGAMIASIFSLLHTFWHVISFYGYRGGDYRLPGVVGLSHMICALVTLINQGDGHYLCAISLAILYIFLFLTAAYTAYLTIMKPRLSIEPRRA